MRLFRQGWHIGYLRGNIVRVRCICFSNEYGSTALKSRKQIAIHHSTNHHHINHTIIINHNQLPRMAERRNRRSVAQPNNYKDFAETGKVRSRSRSRSTSSTSSQERIDSGSENASQSSTRSPSKRSSDGGSNTISFKTKNIDSDNERKEYSTSRSDISMSNTPVYHDRSRGSISSDDLLTSMQTQQYTMHADAGSGNPDNHDEHEHDKQVTRTTVAMAKHKQNIIIIADSQDKQPTKTRTPRRKKRDISTDELLEIGVNPGDDDLDQDTEMIPQGKNSKNNPKGARPKSPAKRTHKTKTPKKETPKKQKLSVASRLSSSVNANRQKQSNSSINVSLFNDASFNAENRRAERDREAAEQMLIHSQREAELARKRREAQEAKRKAQLLQKQTEKENRRAEREQERYERTLSSDKNTGQIRRDSAQTGNKTLDKTINKAKQKARELNPLRRARSNYTPHDGSNNPNIEGLDNGLNAWLDCELNEEEVDPELRCDARYAKRNSDNNRFYNIDDVPIRGPPGNLGDDVESVISITEATERANELLNDDNLYICRETGMRRHRERDAGKPSMSVLERNAQVHHERGRTSRRPIATVTNAQQRPNEWREPIDRPRYQNRRRRQGQDRWDNDYYDRYDETECEGWDTDYDNISDNEEPLVKQPLKTKNVTFSRSRDSRNTQRDRERGREKQDDRYQRDRSERRDSHHDSRWERNHYEKGRRNISSSSESDVGCGSNNVVRRIKSGISAKPSSGVLEQKMYPHFSLGRTSGFIGQDVKFENLTYEQFIAGKLLIINAATDPDEILGRTQLLQRIAMWRLRNNVSWPQVRQTFAHILRRLEDREITWRANWDDFERRIYDKVHSTVYTTNQPPTTRPRRTNNAPSNNNEVVWFCKNFQRIEGCPKDAPHPGRIGNTFRQLHHICAACWLRDKVKKYHPETSSECPHKEA